MALIEEHHAPVGSKIPGWSWRIYFVIFVLYRLADLVLERELFRILFSVLQLVLVVSVLYSWIWNKRVAWLTNVRWLVKFWSVQFFIFPIAFLFWGYQMITTGTAEASGWVITIIVQYPALYIVYRIAWKSRLLYRMESVPGSGGTC